MAEFKLEIITPERQVLSTSAEAVTCLCPDGELTVLASHAPMLASLAIGEIRIKEKGQWRSAFNSEGFLEARPDEVIIFVQAFEWPEEVDVARAERAKDRMLEKLKHQQSQFEHAHVRISLSRAMARLRVTQNKH